MKKRILVENTRLLCLLSIPHIYRYVWFYNKFNFIAGVWDYVLYMYPPKHQKKEINRDVFRGYDVYSELKTIEQLEAYVQKEVDEEYKDSYLDLIRQLDFDTLYFCKEEIKAMYQAYFGIEEVQVFGTVDDIELESESGKPVSREKTIECLEEGVWWSSDPYIVNDFEE